MADSGSLKFAPDFIEAIAAAAAAAEGRAGIPKLPAGDVNGRRKWADDYFGQMLSKIPPLPSVTQTEHEIKASDGATVVVTQFRPSSAPSKDSPAILYAHGGGMILGDIKTFAPIVAIRAETTGIPIFAVEYRLAPEYPHPTPVNDCYEGLTWLHSHAPEVGIDNSRIMLFGESAGGGLAAGVALMARDRKLSPPVAYQLLVYPMLDDRNLEPIQAIEPFAMWKSDDNKTGWGALLGKAVGSDQEVDGHEYAAPARAKSVAGLPPTYIDVGGLDIFASEDTLYASRLVEAGVQVEFHLYPGLPHAFEGAAPNAPIVKAALANRQRVTDEFKKGA